MFKLVGIVAIASMMWTSGMSCCHNVSEKVAPYINPIINAIGKGDLVQSVAMLQVGGVIEEDGKQVRVGYSASGVAINNKHIISAAHFCIPAKAGIDAGVFDRNIQMVYLNNNDEIATMDGLKIISFDKILDICLLERVNHGLIPRQIAKKANIHRFDKVTIIGAPLGMFPVKTYGEIAIPYVDLEKFTAIWGRMIVTAPSTQGNSGGPAFNEKGEIVGLVQGTYGYDHAIVLVPSWMINKFLKANSKLLR